MYHAATPGCASQSARHAQQLEAQHVRHGRDVGQRELRTREPAAAGRVDQLQELGVVLERLARELRLQAVERHVALVFGALLERRLGEPLVDLLAGKAREPRPEGGGERQDGARVVHVLVDQLVHHSHLRPRERFARHERRARKRLVQVVQDHRRLDHDPAVMDERRHHAVRVELHVRRVELVAAQRHQVALVFEALFRQRHAHLLRADGIHTVVELETHRTVIGKTWSVPDFLFFFISRPGSPPHAVRRRRHVEVLHAERAERVEDRRSSPPAARRRSPPRPRL